MLVSVDLKHSRDITLPYSVAHLQSHHAFMECNINSFGLPSWEQAPCNQQQMWIRLTMNDDDLLLSQAVARSEQLFSYEYK